MNKFCLQRAACLVFSVVLVLLTLFVMLSGWRLRAPSKMDFRLHGAQYQRMVEQVENARLAPGVHLFCLQEQLAPHWYSAYNNSF